MENLNLIDDEEFYRLYKNLCKPLTNYPKSLKEKISEELDQLHENLSSNLELKFPKLSKQYEISYDWNVCYHHSMIIYSKKLICIDFLYAVKDAIDRLPNKWTFHIASDLDARHDDCDMFYYDGTFYCNKSDDFPYEQFKQKKIFKFLSNFL